MCFNFCFCFHHLFLCYLFSQVVELLRYLALVNRYIPFTAVSAFEQKKSPSADFFCSRPCKSGLTQRCEGQVIAHWLDVSPFFNGVFQMTELKPVDERNGMESSWASVKNDSDLNKDSCLAILKDNLPQTNLPIILQMAQFLLPVGPQAVSSIQAKPLQSPFFSSSHHVNYGITATWWFISMCEKRRYWKKSRKNQTHFLKGQTVRIHLLQWSIWHQARTENTKWRISDPDAVCSSQFDVVSNKEPSTLRCVSVR